MEWERCYREGKIYRELALNSNECIFESERVRGKERQGVCVYECISEYKSEI